AGSVPVRPVGLEYAGPLPAAGTVAADAAAAARLLERGGGGGVAPRPGLFPAGAAAVGCRGLGGFAARSAAGGGAGGGGAVVGAVLRAGLARVLARPVLQRPGAAVDGRPAAVRLRLVPHGVAGAGGLAAARRGVRRGRGADLRGGAGRSRAVRGR